MSLAPPVVPIALGLAVAVPTFVLRGGRSHFVEQTAFSTPLTPGFRGFARERLESQGQ